MDIVIIFTAALVSSKTTLRIANRNNIPLVGFPVRSLDEWQRTLVEAGFNLAICNQTSNKYLLMFFFSLFKCYILFIGMMAID